MNAHMDELRGLLTEIQNLGVAASVVSFDRETRIPKKAAKSRGRVMGTLAQLSHQQFTSPRVGELLEALREPSVLSSLSSTDQALVRTQYRDYRKATKLPSELVGRFSQKTAEAQVTWAEAREKSDFQVFAPHLQELIGLAKEKAALLRESDAQNLYDVMLDEFEQDTTTAVLDPLFAELKEGIVPLIQAIGQSTTTLDTKFKTEPVYPKADQKAFGEQVARDMGFDFEAGFLDEVVHPFCSGIDSPVDVRVTTRYSEKEPFMSLYGIIHEVGHGLYEQGVNADLLGTPLATGTSLGIHESQSRLWENMVGRSHAFWQHYFDIYQQYFSEQLQGVDLGTFYRGVNEVKPSFIRVEADEVTYSLHIMLRYEIEKQLILEALPVAELPQAWNDKMKAYFDLTPPNDAQGCLQDVHWSMGAFGYFPTYALGNLYGAQFFRTMQHQFEQQHHPGYVQEQIATGQMLFMREWLREKIHDVGAGEDPASIVVRVTGGPLQASHFIQYLWQKYSGVYPDVKAKQPTGVA